MKSLKKIVGWILFGLLCGTFLLSACSAAGNPLEATSWELVSYRNAEGGLSSKETNTIVTAIFQADQVSGIASCNNYTAPYEIDGKKLTFSPAATTRKICPEPTGAMRQEDAYLSALMDVDSFKKSGIELEMRDADGETILVFTTTGQ